MKKFFFLLLFLFSAKKGFNQLKVKIDVHPGTELLSVIHLLADTSEQIKSTYQQDVLKYFGGFSEHAAVKKAKALPYISCDFPLRYSWMFYDFPNLQLFEPESFGAYEKRFTRVQLLDYFKACVQFFNDTHFRKFYQDHANEYAAWKRSFSCNLYDEHMLFIIDSFYRTSPAKEIVFTLGALNCNSYAVSDMRTVNPLFENSTIILIAYGNLAWKYAATDVPPDFYAPGFASQLVWHEAGHIYLHEIFDTHKQQVQALKFIYDNDTTIQKLTGNMGWSMFLEENITQAVTSLLRLNRVPGPDKAKELKRINDFYCLAPPLIEIIEQEYYKKGTFKNFADFFPVLLELLEKKYKKV